MTRRLARFLSVLLPVLAAMPAAAGAQEDFFRLDGLVVTATPTPRPASAVATHVTVLHGDELRAAGLSGVGEALRGVPGLALVQNGSFGATTSLFLRGGESNYVLVLVDGVQVNQPGGSFDFSGLTLDNVERIEIVRGGASALYGSDAVSGVVNIITRTGSGTPRASGSVRAGSYGRFDLTAGLLGGGERAGYSFSLTRARTDGILAFNNQFENTVLSGAVRLSPDDRTRARVSLRVADRRYHYPTDGSGKVVDTNAFTYADETTLGLEVSRRLTERLTVDARVAHAESDGGTDDQPDGPADSLGFYGFTSLDHVRRSSAEVRANLTFEGGVVTLGGEAEDQAQRSFTESLSQFGAFPGRSEYERWNRAAFAHLAGERAAVGYTAGARVEDNERFGSSFSWQLGASVQAAPGVRLRAAASTAIKEPTFFEHFATGFARGNPELDPERSLQWEMGVDATLAGVVGVRVTWFDQSFRDLIQYTGAPPRPDDPNFFNVAEADARGLELQAEAQVGGVRTVAGWTWLDTEVVDPGLDDGPGAEFVTGESLLRRPRNVVTLEVSRNAGSVALTAGLRRVGARFDRDFTEFPAARVELDPYTLVHAGAELQVGPSAALFLRADNLLDRDYEEVVGFGAPGRSLQAGLRLGLGGGR